MSSSDQKSLYEAILKLKTSEECQAFFRDLCTMQELSDMADRWKVVQLLGKGMPYRSISQKTGVSTATITRIAHWLHHGRGGYALLLGRI